MIRNPTSCRALTKAEGCSHTPILAAALVMGLAMSASGGVVSAGRAFPVGGAAGVVSTRPTGLIGSTGSLVSVGRAFSGGLAGLAGARPIVSSETSSSVRCSISPWPWAWAATGTSSTKAASAQRSSLHVAQVLCHQPTRARGIIVSACAAQLEQFIVVFTVQVSQLSPEVSSILIELAL